MTENKVNALKTNASLYGLDINCSSIDADDLVITSEHRHFLTLHVGSPVLLTRIKGKDENIINLQNGSVNIIPCGCTYRWHWEQPCESIRLYFDAVNFQDTGHQLMANGALPVLQNLTAIRDPLIEGIMRTLLSLTKAHTPLDHLFAENLMTSLVLHLLKQYSTSTAALPAGQPSKNRSKLSKPVLARVTEMIEAHISKPISLSDLANEAQLSQYHFTRLFKNTTGVTPYQFVIFQRIEKAKKLITETNMPLGDIALSVGFSSQSHFSHHFKKITGVSPGRFS